MESEPNNVGMQTESSEATRLPRLTVTFGSTARKTRILSKAATLLGKSRSADIKIDAPEVAAVHCVIVHSPTGLLIRDCDTRSGTMVNGQPIRESALVDGDTIQIGPFAFEVSIPAGWIASSDLSAIEGEGHNEDTEALKREMESLRGKVNSLQRENESLKAKGGGTTMANGSTDALPDSVASLQAEVEALRHQLLEVDAQRSRLSEELRTLQQDSESRLAALREELEKERNRIKDVMKQAAGQFNAARQESVHLRQQVELLTAELSAKNAELEAAVAAATGGPAMPADILEYQNQLNAFRDELEQAQIRLQEQENALNESIRQNELQLSRERAEMARERAIIERTRNELRSELELAEREAKNYEKMSSIHKLTQEMRAPGKHVASEADDQSLSNRIRGFLRRLGEGG